MTEPISVGASACAIAAVVLSAAPAATAAAHASGEGCTPAWSALGTGVGSVVRSFALYDADGGGVADLYVGGFFTMAGGMPAARIARWDGRAWSTLGAGTNGQVSALAVFDEDGSGPAQPALFAAGFFTAAGGQPAAHIARFDGIGWSPVGGGIGTAIDETVVALAVFDEDGAGPLPAALFAGGFFFTAGGVAAENIARWNGSAWSAVGGGTNGTVTALRAIDRDGSGPEPTRLVVGGFFNVAGGNAANNIAGWDDEQWTALGAGTDGVVEDVVAFDADGAGPMSTVLVAAGSFSMAGGIAASNVASFDGEQWSPLGAGVDSNVLGLAVFDEDGTGPTPAALFAVGNFSMAGGAPAAFIARWNGTNWAPVDAGGANSQVSALLADPYGVVSGEPALFAGGFFTTIGGIPAARTARLVGCAAPQPGDLDSDGDIDAADLGLLLAAFGAPATAPSGHPAAGGDLNTDGFVDGADLGILLGNWSGVGE